jgi:hypothetical protein
MKTFQLTENIQAVADYGKTRNGFKHEATILKNGSQVGFAKVNYLNRTWEAYEYQTAIQKAIDNSTLSAEEKKKLTEIINR